MTDTTPYTVHKAGAGRYEIRTEYGDCYKAFAQLWEARQICDAMNDAHERKGAELVHHLIEVGNAQLAELEDCTDCDGTGMVSVWYGAQHAPRLEPCHCTAGIAVRAIA